MAASGNPRSLLLLHAVLIIPLLLSALQLSHGEAAIRDAMAMDANGTFEQSSTSEFMHHEDATCADHHANVSDGSNFTVDASSTHGMARPQEVGPGICLYKIVTETGNKWGAGTDSTISIRLLNKDGEFVYFPSLDNGKNNFEKGDIDQFQMPGDCIAAICKLVLATDDSGLFAGWFVDSVSFSVTTPSGRQEKTWELHQWLPNDDASASLSSIRDDC